MKNHIFTCQCEVWKYDGKGAWYFVTIPLEVAKQIESVYGPKRRGWGSIPVTIELGMTKWQTSIFPDRKTDTYLLPLKKRVRERERLNEGDTASFILTVRGIPFHP